MCIFNTFCWNIFICCSSKSWCLSCLYKVSTLWWYVFWTWQTISNNSHIRAITGLFVEADVYQVEMHQTFILEMSMTWGSSFHFNFLRRSVHHLIKHICDQNDGCSALVNGDTDTLHAWLNMYYLTTSHDVFFGDAWKIVGKLLRDSSLYNKTECITTITNHCFSHGVAFHLLEQLGSCKRSRPGGRWTWAWTII